MKIKPIYNAGLQADKEHLDGELELHDVFHDDVEGEGGECPHFPLDNSPGALHSEKDRKCERCHRSWQDLVMKDSEEDQLCTQQTTTATTRGRGTWCPTLTWSDHRRLSNTPICLQRFGRKRLLEQSLPTMGIYTLCLHQ